LRRGLALTLALILAVTSIVMVKSAHAQSIHKPSVPEFTAKLTSSPAESQSVNRTIELSIKNQPFVSNYGFFYNVRMRVNDGNWGLLYPNSNSVPSQSNGEYTILSYSSGYLGVEYQYHLGYKVENLTAGDTIDFQVLAMVGSIQRVINPNFTNHYNMYPYVFNGETGDWSNIRTITIPSSELSPTPSVLELQTWTIPWILAIIVAIAGLFVYHKKQ
jgi:hypothetical protein